MAVLKFDLTKEAGRFKCMNATNGGPQDRRHRKHEAYSNFEAYKAARIPYARNHDANENVQYGGPFIHDIASVFPDFDADPTLPGSYEFPCTDDSILMALDAGTQTFYRLGQTIEHQVKKYRTLPPKDFDKWAVICEHVIRHYNEGWADGFRLNIRYWEIWNEPDGSDGAAEKCTWGGTRQQFFDFFETAAKHLKRCFPDLKIGGPALAHDLEWAEDFLCEMQKRNVPLDFFSWHIYCSEPEAMLEKAGRVRALLDRYGYREAESILNEWNYVRDWGPSFIRSLETIHSIKGAAFAMACMSAAQDSSIDMLMYYDTRQSYFNGVFDFYTCRPLKGWYAFYWYGMFYDAKAQIKAENSIENIYALCGADKTGKALAVLTHYSDDDSAPEKTVTVDFGRPANYEIYILDKDRNGEFAGTTDDLTFTLPVHSCILIRETE